MKNKKGMTVFSLFIFVFVIFFFILFLGLALWGFNLVNDVFDQDLEVGQVNLRDINNQTFGRINQGFIDNADNLGLILILGMAFLMILNGYFVGSRFPKLFFVVDIFILIFVFILSVYISQVYEILINSTDLLSTIYINDIPRSSAFVLNLPVIIGTLGALIMIVSYSGIRKKEEEPNVYGY